MNTFLNFSVFISNQLSFKAKFLILSLVCLIPVSFSFSFLIGEANQVRASAEKSLHVTEYIKPLRNLVELVAQTRGMTNAYLLGDSSFEGKILTKRTLVDDNLNALISVADTYPILTESQQAFPQKLKQQWTALNARAFSSSAPEIFGAYTKLINSVLDFLDTVGREGHLLQEADPANSYAIRTLLNTLPNQVEALGKLRGKGSGVIASGDFSVENRLAVSSLANPRYLKALQKDMNYLFGEDDHLKTVLNSDYLAAETSLKAFFQLTQNQILSTPSSPIASSAFFKAGTECISKMLVLYDKLLPELYLRMEKRASRSSTEMQFLIAGLGLVSFILIYAFFGIYLGIKRSINELSDAANAMCDGDLDARMNIKTKDEMHSISENFNNIAEGISFSILSILRSSEEISHTAHSIEKDSSKTALAMANQSDELGTTSTAITEMNSSVSEVAGRTEAASEAADKAKDQALRGENVVNKAVQNIDSLTKELISAVEVVEELEENSKSITNILDVIQSIAEQTNLLALNAAIEAARAGEQGRGFAVVADEVRSLAQRTQNSTQEIQTVIDLIQKGIERVVSVIRASEQNAVSASSQAQEAGLSLKQISEAVMQITDMSTQIATAAHEQSYVAEEITKSVVKIADDATVSAGSANKLAASGVQLSAMSKEMKLILNRYSVNEEKLKESRKNINLLTWDSQKEIGVSESDRQHRQMIDMMNNVHTMIAQNRSDQAVATAVSSLIDYTQVHFQWEESMLEKIGYPRLEQHKEEHAKLLNEIQNYKQNVITGNRGDIDRTVDKLNDWLVNHVRNSDSDYAQFIETRAQSH